MVLMILSLFGSMASATHLGKAGEKLKKYACTTEFTSRKVVDIITATSEETALMLVLSGLKFDGLDDNYRKDVWLNGPSTQLVRVDTVKSVKCDLFLNK